MDAVSCKPPSVIDRYYKKRFKIDNHGKEGEDQVVLTHSNRVCVVCLANSHPILQDQKTVTKVDFCPGGVNRLDTKLSGKSKRGAHWLDGKVSLCEVSCDDGTKYLLTCGVKGQLLEVNEKLITQPQLLTQKPLGIGFLAVMLPGIKKFDKEISRLKTEDEYKAILTQRKQKTK